MSEARSEALTGALIMCSRRAGVLIAIFVSLLLVYLMWNGFNQKIPLLSGYFDHNNASVDNDDIYPEITIGSNQVTSEQLHHDDSHNFLVNTPSLGKSTTKWKPRKPNVIFAMADDLGWGDVGYNNGGASTPNLNEMALSPNSILLQRYYSGAPICSPTRGTVLTGRNHNRYCLWSANSGFNAPDFSKAQPMPLPLSEITVAELMREVGYSTALFGKWHLGDFKRVEGGNRKWPVSHPGLHGFDQWQATERSAQTCTTNCGCFNISKCINGHYRVPPSCINYHTNKSDTIEGWPNLIPEGDSHFIFSLAEIYIREQVKANRPFFLYLPFHAVHVRYIATNFYRNFYQSHNRNLSKNLIDYYGAISEMDDVIGKLRNLLLELGIKDNTLLWFSSDNGPEGMSPGKTNGLRGMKTQLFEGGVRVPGIIEWPDVITSNKVSSFPVVSSDLLPTVCDIVGIESPNDRPIDGISILPFLEGKIEHRNENIYWAFHIPGDFNKGYYQISTSGERYKLLVEYNNGKVVNHHLYDLVNDLQEKIDLSKKYPSLCKKLLTGIEKWRKSVMDSAQKVGCL